MGLEPHQNTFGVKFAGINQSSETGGFVNSEKNLPVKGLHPFSRNQFATVDAASSKKAVNHLSRSEGVDFSKMLVLPSIKSRKIEDLENSENPFKVIKQSE